MARIATVSIEGEAYIPHRVFYKVEIEIPNGVDAEEYVNDLDLSDYMDINKVTGVEPIYYMKLGRDIDISFQGAGIDSVEGEDEDEDEGEDEGEDEDEGDDDDDDDDE